MSAKQINLSGINLNINKKNNVGGNIYANENITSGSISCNSLTSINNIILGSNAITLNGGTGSISAKGNMSAGNMSTTDLTSTNNVSVKNDVCTKFLYIGCRDNVQPNYSNCYAKFVGTSGNLSIQTGNGSGDYDIIGTINLNNNTLKTNRLETNRLKTALTEYSIAGSDEINYIKNTSNPAIFFNIRSSDNRREFIFKFNNVGSTQNGAYFYKSPDKTNWDAMEVPDKDSAPYSYTLNHTSLIDENTNLNSYKIGEPIFLNNNYNNYYIDEINYHYKFMKITNDKIQINNNTCNKTFFNITNIPNNNFVGICSIVSEKIIVKQTYNELFRKYFFEELTEEQIQEYNLDINNLPEDYIILYKINNDFSLNINQDKTYYFDKPVIAFATHGDYMFYVNDIEALIDTNLNTQKHYEIGDELTYDGKILILPEFNPNDNLTETQQLQELINYNKQMSNYNKLKKNSIGKISHIFTSQECDDYKHYLAVFKSN